MNAPLDLSSFESVRVLMSRFAPESSPADDLLLTKIGMQTEIKSLETLINRALSNGNRQYANKLAKLKGDIHSIVRDIETMERGNE